jgi:hypothetical protein
VKEADIDSEGNEFLSCKSEEFHGSSLVEEEENKGEDEWSDESEEKPKKKKRAKGARPHPPRAQ